jgi:uncharacterized protein (DUF2141 family)
MKLIIHNFITHALILMANFCWAQQSGNLTISAGNFGNSTGKAVANLFRESDDIPQKPFMQSTAAITNGTAQIIFNDIPFGSYAAIVFHDENANGKLDHKWGFPDEPMGFSNAWKLSMFSGMPTFTKLRFEFSKNQPLVSININ